MLRRNFLGLFAASPLVVPKVVQELNVLPTSGRLSKGGGAMTSGWAHGYKKNYLFEYGEAAADEAVPDIPKTVIEELQDDLARARSSYLAFKGELPEWYKDNLVSSGDPSFPDHMKSWSPAFKALARREVDIKDCIRQRKKEHKTKIQRLLWRIANGGKMSPF
jgi:hypothetical protein